MLAGLGFLLAGSGALSAQTVIYVSPAGNDDQSGLARHFDGSQGPVATIERALQVARAVRRAGTSPAGIAIEIDTGVYRPSSTLVLAHDDSGTEAAPFVIRAASGADVRVTGARLLALEGDDPPAHLRARVPAAARDRVVFIDLRRRRLDALATEAPRGALVPRHPAALELFDRDGTLTRARWPSDRYTRSRALAGVTEQGGLKIVLSETPRQSWADERAIWAGGFFTYDWNYETVRVDHVDLARQLLALDKLSTSFKPHAGQRFFLYNILSELTAERTYYVDPDSGFLVVWPAVSDAGLEVSVLTELLDIRAAHDVRIDGVRFDRVRGDAIRISDSDRISVGECLISETGGRGIVVAGGTRNVLSRTVFTDIGNEAIVLGGGDRRTLVPSRHEARDNIVRRFGRLTRTFNAAITLNGVGQSVVGNMIADGPSIGVQFYGNDHVIALNEFTRIVSDAKDLGAVYTFRDWTARGTLIANNFFHDLAPYPGAEIKGVYLDDFASGITVRGNLFLKTMRSVLIGGGRDNIVEANAFIRSDDYALHIDDRGANWASDSIISPTSELRQHLNAVPYASEPYASRYPALPRILDDEPAQPKGNRIVDNVVLSGHGLRIPSRLVSRQILDQRASSAAARMSRSLEHALADDKPVTLEALRDLTIGGRSLESLLNVDLNNLRRSQVLSDLRFWRSRYHR